MPFRRAAAGVLVLVAALAVLLLSSRGEKPRPPATHPKPASPVIDRPADGPSLAVGITEENPNLIAGLPPPDVEPQWAQRRAQMARLNPLVYRMFVPWNEVQPRADAPPDLSLAENGCVRDKGPCAGFAGLRDQLRAVASRGGQVMIVLAGLPDWAVAHVRGCLRGASPVAGMPRADALAAYRTLIADVLALARDEGADVRYVSPYNEPNHPYSLAPQRRRCDPSAPSLAARGYTPLARAAQQALDDAPGDQELVLGETAGFREPTSRATGVPELIRELPRSVVCSAHVWSQHAYVGGTDPVDVVEKALDARDCPQQYAIWITETGVGPAPGGLSLARGITSEAQGCRLLHQRLLQWYRDPRVTLAVQYEFREDNLFPTGLVTTDLKRERPALAEWTAWGGDRGPSDPPPASTCSKGG